MSPGWSNRIFRGLPDDVGGGHPWDVLGQIFVGWVLFNETLVKDLLLLATNLIEEIPDSCNTKEYYQSFVREKNKISKTIKNNSHQPKTFENSGKVDINSIITEHPKNNINYPKL